MVGNRDMRGWLRIGLFLSAALIAAPAWSADGATNQEQVRRQETQPLNNAPVWRDVRGGENPYQTTQVQGIETNILVQTEGQVWREIRNGPVTVYGGWLMVVVFLLIALYYGIKGAIKLHGKPTGRTIERFNAWDRLVHWTTAISFVILALSGLVMLFGKYVVLPVFGYTLFSWLAILSKNLHNFVGPLFIVSALAMYLTFLKDNMPKGHDVTWFFKAGGMFSGEHVPSGRYNAGEKAWYWLGFVLLFVVGITGIILDFPSLAPGRAAMQESHVIHAISAILYMTASLGHIYLGTLGVEGAYEGMRNGMVDETWAKEHHEYWYNDVKGQSGMGGGAPSAVHATSVKEGWKL